MINLWYDESYWSHRNGIVSGPQKVVNNLISSLNQENIIFSINEKIRPLKSELEDVLLEFNYLSSPEKLVQYQTQYFEKDLIKIEIMNIKEIIENNETLEINDLINKNSNEQ